jgi:ABC-type antimicrobial peptide transport system permease subunit
VLDRWRVEDLARSFRNPEWLKATLEVESGRSGFSPVRDVFRNPLQVVMVLVAVLLAIGCSNIGSVLLARSTARRQEFAVRLALGAGRFRLVRQLLTESVLLALVGGALGVALAIAGGTVLTRILTSGRPMRSLPVPLEIPIALDGRVLLFAAIVSLVTGVLFGLAPAWFAVSEVPASLRTTGRVVAGWSGRVLGNGPIVTQIALSVVLLSVTGVLVS